MMDIVKKILLWIILFVCTPVILGYLIMRPILVEPAKIVLPKDDQKLELIPVDLTKTPFDDFSEVIFGTPLKLKWYKICLDNQNEVSTNEVKIKLPYDKDPEAGAMEAKINLRSGASYKIYAPINQQICDYVKIENSVADITMVYRKPSPTSFDPVFKVVQSDEKGGSALVHQSAYVHNDKSNISLINLWSEFIYKLFVFAGVWMILIVNLRESWRIFGKRQGK